MKDRLLSEQPNPMAGCRQVSLPPRCLICLERVHVKDHLPGWLEQSSATIPSDHLRLSERIVRVEEALKNQNLLMEKRFEDMNKRFKHISRQVAHSFGWTIGIMSGLFVALGVLITVYRFLGAAG